MQRYKHFVRDVLIWAISISGIASIYRNRMRRRGPLVRVIAFHHIKDAEWFDRTIKFLTEEFHIITPEQFHSNEFHPSKINLLITFDDGYTSWINKALPVLTKYNMKALFFIISRLLDVAKAREARRTFFRERLFLTPKSALTWKGALRLANAGHTVGGHTVTHPNLAELDRDAQKSEIRGNKEALESHLGVTVTDFAYPFGRREHFTEETKEIAKENGYEYIYTAETGFYAGDDAEIPRTLIERGQSRASIKRWIQGGYDIFSKSFQALLK